MRYKYFRDLDPRSQEMYSLIGILSKKIDWQMFGPQMVNAKRGVAIHIRHEYRALHLEFEGFGDLFCQLASLLWQGRSIAQNNIGINNCVILNYCDDLPRKDLQLVVIPFEGLS